VALLTVSRESCVCIYSYFPTWCHNRLVQFIKLRVLQRTEDGKDFLSAARFIKCKLWRMDTFKWAEVKFLMSNNKMEGGRYKEWIFRMDSSTTKKKDFTRLFCLICDINYSNKIQTGLEQKLKSIHLKVT
jgi:hypothetical protein